MSCYFEGFSGLNLAENRIPEQNSQPFMWTATGFEMTE